MFSKNVCYRPLKVRNTYYIPHVLMFTRYICYCNLISLTDGTNCFLDMSRKSQKHSTSISMQVCKITW